MATIGTKTLKIKVGSVEYNTQVTRCEITATDADMGETTFSEAGTNGVREYALEFTALQDADTTALWNYVWANAGTTVAVKFNPYGVTTASATQPIYTGNVTIYEPDGTLIGGEANTSLTARMTYDCRWVFTAKPTKDTASAY